MYVRFLGGNGGNFYPVERDTPNAVNLVATPLKTTLNPMFNLVQVGYDDTNLDVYIPFFLLLQFIFYFGWLKVLLCKLYRAADEVVSILRSLRS